MSRIILHVGTHKTATTTVQDSMALNRDRLATRGLIFPVAGPNAGQHALVTRWIELPERYRGRRPALETWQALAARHAGGDAAVFVSSEEFSRNQPTRVDMRELAGLVAGFDRRTVVCVLRNQLAYLQSIYLQITKESRGPSVEAFLNQALRSNHATGVMLDYGALYDHLLTGFGADEIVFLSYEAAVRDPGGVLGHLLAGVGLPGLTEGLAPLPSASNVSPEPLASWAANQIATPRVADPGLTAQAQAALRETFGEGVRSTIYSRPEVTRVAAHFAPLNAAFEARYREVAPDFALAPLTLSDDLVYRGQLTAPQFWIKFGQRVYNQAGK
jgi:hypothetical protein